MAAKGKFPLRLLLYGVATIYVVGDLFVFKGPLRHRLDLVNPTSAASIEAAKARGVVARVAGYPITRGQLDRATDERLWLDGKSVEGATPAELEAASAAALQDLIDHELLRLQVQAVTAQLEVTDEEINERMQRLLGRFQNKGDMETAMKSQGIPDEKALLDRTAARIRQEKFIRMRVGPFVRVTEEDARKWFDENSAKVASPERIEARHVFLATLNRPPEEAKQKLDEALSALNSGTKDFATLAKELSDDPASKENGGNLGWMSQSRLPADFAVPVFALELNKPSLVRTKLGWHLVEVTARKPAEPRGFDQAKDEITAALETAKRDKAVEDFKKSLRKAEASKIEVLTVTAN